MSLNHWLHDMTSRDPGALVISTRQSRLGSPHIPADHIQLRVTMVEAMDDSALFATRLSSIRLFALLMERFQAVYGWLTSWPKSLLLIRNVPDPPSTLSIPTIDPPDFSSDIVPLQPVSVVTNHLEFLRVHTNDLHTQYLRIRDLIENFEFPSLSYRLPFTVLRRIVSQCLISSIRPRLSFQPISKKDAKSLDLLIAKKIHEYLSFPFAFNSTLLSLPLSLHGFDFPSITRIIDACALQGLQRDLNHHVPSFRMMADITLADWTCSFNHCCSPLGSSSALGNSRPSFTRRRNLLPWAWILAHNVMSELNVSFRHTDQSHLFLGSVVISHVSRSLSSQHTLSAHIINSLTRLNILFLSQIATWTYTTHPISQPQPTWSLSPRDDVLNFLSNNIPAHQTTALSTWLHHLSLAHITYGLDSSLAIPRHLRQHEAEHHTLALLRASPLPPFASPTPILASDASMIPPSVPLHQSRSVTPAVSSTFGSVTASLQPLRRSASTLHGEVYGLITAVVLLRSEAPHSLSHSLPPIITDHLNSTRLISDSFIQSKPPLSWSALPARSLCRWLRDLLSQFPTRPALTYTPVHTSSTSLPSIADAHADHCASSSQYHPLSKPTHAYPYLFYGSLHSVH